MQIVPTFVTQHGYTLLLAAVLVEQIGLPVPSVPVLLAAGALAAAGGMHVAAIIGVVWVAALMVDIAWYESGRRRGTRVLNFLCRLSQEPSSCAQNVQGLFARWGARTLLFAKFVPGFGIAAPPVAGAIRLRVWKFLLYDSLGILLWAGVYVGLGYLLSDQIEQIARYSYRVGASVVILVIVGTLTGYILRRYWKRRQFLRELRMARITPEELRDKLNAGENLFLVDLRHPLDFLPHPYLIPGAVRMPMAELERRHGEIPRDRDVVLYCTCPDEGSSARTALLLKQKGITPSTPARGRLLRMAGTRLPV